MPVAPPVHSLGAEQAVKAGNHSAFAEEVAELFHGRDPFSEAMHRIRNMSQTELTALIFIAAGRLGSALKGGEYEGTRDSLVHIASALDIIFDAYDNTGPSGRITLNLNRPG